MPADARFPHDWLDTEAGPVVRPYTVTGGRVRSASGALDVVAFVVATQPNAAAGRLDLQPEHRAILAVARDPVSVAELASELDLALGVVRVLLGDLLSDGLVSTHEPSAAEIPDDDILKAVVNGLRAL
jgi:hypothetical protein